MEERTLEQIEADEESLREKIKKLNKKKGKGKELSASETRNLALYEKNLNELSKEKENLGKKPATVNTPPVATPTSKGSGTGNVGSKGSGGGAGGGTRTGGSKETKLTASEGKAVATADEMNSEEEKNKKVGDAGSAAETARDMANTVDANVEENVPTWFWREAREMAPSDKAKQGFIISNYILNRLGTAAGNIGAIIQNAGGSGGATLKEHGGSYIDQYRQSKLDQAMANRKTKQNNLLQQQIDALVAIGASENEARAIQNKLRNSKYWNKYNRLTNEQQVYIQGLLYSDTKGEITDAVLGDFIDRIMEGKDISLNNVAATALTAAGIDNVDKLTREAGSIGEKVTNWLAGAAGWKKPGE